MRIAPSAVNHRSVAASFITFRKSHRRREMYCGHARLSVCLSAAACQHYCTDPDVTWGSGRGCPLVEHHCADLQSVRELRCYGNITRTRNVSEYMLVLAPFHCYPSALTVDAVKAKISSTLFFVYVYFIKMKRLKNNQQK